MQSEMKQVLDRAIGDLPESYRAVILLRDIEELSTGETAQILEVTEDTVKTRLHRARLALRKTLDERLRARPACRRARIRRSRRMNMASHVHSREIAKKFLRCFRTIWTWNFRRRRARRSRAHIAGCPPCVEFAESLRKTVELCRRYQPSELPEPIGTEARDQLMQAYRKHWRPAQVRNVSEDDRIRVRRRDEPQNRGAVRHARSGGATPAGAGALRLAAGEQVLDIGSGPGLLAQEMALAVGPNGRVWGLDASPAMVAMSANRCAEQPWAEFRTADAAQLPYPGR